MAGNFPAGRWTRVFRPARSATLLIYCMLIIRQLFVLVNHRIVKFIWIDIPFYLLCLFFPKPRVITSNAHNRCSSNSFIFSIILLNSCERGEVKSKNHVANIPCRDTLLTSKLHQTYRKLFFHHTTIQSLLYILLVYLTIFSLFYCI